MQKLTIAIDGMSCASCANSITKHLKSKDLLADIHINLIAKTATLTLQDSQSLEPIFAAITKLGYKPALLGENLACAHGLESRASSLRFVNKPQALSPYTLIKCNSSSTILEPPSGDSKQLESEKSASLESMFEKVDSQGNTINVNELTKDSRIVDEKSEACKCVQERTLEVRNRSTREVIYDLSRKTKFISIQHFLHKHRVLLSGVCALIVLYLAMAPMLLDSALIAPFSDMRVNFFTQLFLALASMHLGRDYYFKGFRTLLAKSPTMDSLIAISTTAALAYSVHNALLGRTHWYFESICVILFFVLFGKGLEQNAKDTTSSVIRALLLGNLSQVLRIDTHKERQISPQEIRIGDKLRILPAQTIPADGIVYDGEGGVDESMLSGEVIPVEKRAGDRVYAGSINTNRAFIMRATSTSEHSTLGALGTLVQEAMSSKPSIAKLADVIAAYFVPAVIAVALVAFGIWWMCEGVDFAFGVFISVLVISCPCALGLATPMAVMIGTALANRQGVFIKQAQSFEKLGKISDVVFDKTGTLTQATLKVVAVKSLCNLSEREILALSAGLEKGSEHIIAKAIIQEVQQQGIKPSEFGEFCVRAGFGIEAIKGGYTYALGNQAMFAGQIERITQEGQEGYIEVLLGKKVDSSYELLGIITLEDTLKPKVQELLQALKDKGLTPHILSGDSDKNTKRIAESLGVMCYLAGIKPEDKLAYIQELQKQGKVVMMVGDGLNDVGALAAADVSLSFAEANDVSKNTADIIIYHNDILRILFVMSLSKKVIQNIRENLGFAFVYNCICIPLACGVLYYPAQILLNPMISAFAMSASSISVVLNSQRLWKYRF